MYGGLFGDLPPTKDQQQKDKLTASDKSNKTLTSSKNEPAESDLLLSNNTSTKQQRSVVSSLGVAGTSMEFVPAAVRYKRPTTTAVPFQRKQRSRSGEQPTAIHVEQIPDARGQETEANATVARSSAAFSNVTKPDDVESDGLPSSSRKNLSHCQLLQQEAKELGGVGPQTISHERRLEEPLQHGVNGVQDDPYNPYLPNDLLEYWEQQAIKRKIQEQEKQRLELERKLSPEQLPVMPSRGRGRGGVSNMPAWMMRQQKEQKRSDHAT